MLGSGNLGLIYLMEEQRRLTLEEIQDRHPRLVPTLRQHRHVGFLLANSADHGPVALGDGGVRYLLDGRVEGNDPLCGFSENAPQHLVRSIGFEDAPDLFVNSFYDEQVDEGCAFEELISFHGGWAARRPAPSSSRRPPSASREADRRRRARSTSFSQGGESSSTSGT